MSKLRVNDSERNTRIYRLVQAEQPALSARDHAFLCGAHDSIDEFERAISECEIILRRGGDVRDAENALCYYAWSMKALRRTEELIAALENLQTKGMGGELLLCELGAACLGQKKYDEAERTLLQALETPVECRDLFLHFDAYDVFLPCQKLSKLYAAKGDLETAYAYHRRAARVYPGNPGVRLNDRFFQKAIQ